MNPSVLHQLWTVIEETEPRRLLRLQGAALTEWLITEMQVQQFLTHKEIEVTRNYISTRQIMIHDIARGKIDARCNH